MVERKSWSYLFPSYYTWPYLPKDALCPINPWPTLRAKWRFYADRPISLTIGSSFSRLSRRRENAIVPSVEVPTGTYVGLGRGPYPWTYVLTFGSAMSRSTRDISASVSGLVVSLLADNRRAWFSCRRLVIDAPRLYHGVV